MKYLPLALLLILMLLAAACEDRDDDAQTADEPSAASSDSTGEASPQATTDDPSATATRRERPSPTAGSGSGSPDTDVVDALESADVPFDLASGTTMGSEDAPLHIRVYEDYQCPFCLRYTAFAEPGFYGHIRDGNVLYEVVPFPILGPESFGAALAAGCAADQDMYWQFARELFLTQAEAGQSSNEQLNVGRFSIEGLQAIADEVGLDRTVFDPCLETAQHQEEIEQAQADAHALGVNSTPSFSINGELVPGQAVPGSAGQWDAFIDMLLEQTASGEA